MNDGVCGLYYLPNIDTTAIENDIDNSLISELLMHQLQQKLDCLMNN